MRSANHLPSATLTVIPTTHWDRDWYWPLERFRVKLIELFQTVRELWDRYPEYRFAIDGQCAPVEDYLEAVPGDRDALERMGRAGRFTMGPLYVQSDLYCTGGEAFIRNMLIGKELAESFHALQHVVYLPDTFGHTPSIPMLVAGFGYRTYAFMRGQPPGFPDTLRFFRWRCPDGSEVHVFRLRDGYANAARLGLHRGTGEVFDKKSSGIRPRFNMEMAVEQLGTACERQVDGQGEPHVLLAGVDHQIPQPQLIDIMKGTESHTRRLVIGDWNEVDGAMAGRDWSSAYVYEGEFHGRGASSILGGTVSTRVYLKQANAEAERQLTQVAEPAEALAALVGRTDAAGGAVTLAWKRLLKAHPHDDITGCSVDPVHRENEMHIACALQAADAVRRRMGHHLIQHYGGQRPGDERYAFFLASAQTGEAPRRAVVKLDYEGRLNWGDIKPFEYYDVVDEQGCPVPFRELSRGRSTEHPHPVVMLEVAAPLEPFRFSRFFVEKRPRWPRTPSRTGAIENERLKVTLASNGSIELYDKLLQREWKGLGLFSDQADCGDEYTFSHIRGDSEVVFSRLRTSPNHSAGCNGLQVLSCRGVLRIPRESTPKGRCSTKSLIPITLEYSLAPGEAAVSCRILFENTAHDHRLRWNLPVPWNPKQSRAGLKFNEVVRAAGKRERRGKGFVIDPEHPADHFVALENKDAGIAVFSRFPFNYEICRAPSPRLAVCLLRAVGMLSRGDMLTRGGGAGPDTLTPDAQCLRGFDMTFGIRPYSPATEGGGLFAEAVRWRSAAASELILGFEPDIRPEVDQGPPLAVVGEGVVVSALKRSHDRGATILRLFNASAGTTKATVTAPVGQRVSVVGLDEVRVLETPLVDSSGRFSIDMNPWSLATVRLEE